LRRCGGVAFFSVSGFTELSSFLPHPERKRRTNTRRPKQERMKMKAALVVTPGQHD
jgi:hypothetical protein